MNLLRGKTQIRNGTVVRDNLNIVDTGDSLLRKIIAGSGISLESTGIDPGTGDVIITSSGGSGTWDYKIPHDQCFKLGGTGAPYPTTSIFVLGDYCALYEKYDDCWALSTNVGWQTNPDGSIYGFESREDVLIVGWNSDYSHQEAHFGDINNVDHGNFLSITSSGAHFNCNIFADNLTASGVLVSGVTNFLDLSDTPDTYTGNAGKSVVVNETETGLVFTPQNNTTFFTVEGVLSIVADPKRLYNISGISRTISKVFLSVGTAPTDASILVDIHKDGTTIFTNQAHRPAVLTTANTGFTTDIDIATWADGSYLEVYIDQVGSTVAGSDLVIHILYS